MLIRKVAILFVIGLFAFGLSFYIVKNLSPLDFEKLQEIANEKQIDEDDEKSLNNEIHLIIERGFIFQYLTPSAYAALFLFMTSIFFLFSSLHMLIDKLFFKKFYEYPSNFMAFRRAFLLAITLGTILFMNLYGFDLPTIGISILLAFLMEVMFLLFWKRSPMKESKQSES